MASRFGWPKHNKDVQIRASSSLSLKKSRTASSTVILKLASGQTGRGSLLTSMMRALLLGIFPAPGFGGDANELARG
jgi:hypothetical protein